MNQVATVLITDRYLFISHSSTELNDGEIELNFDYQNAEILKYEDRHNQRKMRLSLQSSLERVKELCPNLRSLVIGSCIAVKSTATLDRDPDPKAAKHSPYGVLEWSAARPDWEGINVYEIAAKAFPHIASNIYVRADVSLAALGEYHFRLSERGYPVAPPSHILKNKGVPLQERDITLAYVKLSSDINGAFVYDGHLLGGINHPSLFGIKPRRMVIDGNIDEYEGHTYFKTCYSGLASAIALQDRLRGAGVHEPLHTLKRGHPIWNILEYYVTQLCLTIMAMHVPTSIVLGGRLVRDQIELSFPANDIVERVQSRVEREVGEGEVKYPYIEDTYDFIKKAACKTPVAYGGLHLAAAKLYAADPIAEPSR